MATTQLSMKTKQEAHALALRGHTWQRGRSKVDGRPFYVIPSRTQKDVAHWTTSYGCTCEGARKRGDCAHQESVRMFEAREAAAVKPKARYEDIFVGLGDSLTDAF